MNEEALQVRTLLANLREREALSPVRGELQEEGEEVIPFEAEPVLERCTWCGDDISRSRHDVFKTNCRICGNIAVRHYHWVQKQEEKRARKLAGLPPLEDGPPPLSPEEIKQAITGRRIRR